MFNSLKVYNNCSLIAVVDQNMGIGRNGDQLVYISNDLKRFKQLTSGCTIVMGRKTFEALPKGALPNRRNIIVSRNKNSVFPNCETACSVEEVFDMINNEKEVFIIGGGEIYRLFFPFVRCIYLTRILHTFENVDTFFPDIDNNEWHITSSEGSFIDEKSSLSYLFETLERKIL